MFIFSFFRPASFRIDIRKSLNGLFGEQAFPVTRKTARAAISDRAFELLTEASLRSRVLTIHSSPINAYLSG